MNSLGGILNVERNTLHKSGKNQNSRQRPRALPRPVQRVYVFR